jgi:hypothetical protein
MPAGFLYYTMILTAPAILNKHCMTHTFCLRLHVGLIRAAYLDPTCVGLCCMDCSVSQNRAGRVAHHCVLVAGRVPDWYYTIFETQDDYAICP